MTEAPQLTTDHMKETSKWRSITEMLEVQHLAPADADCRVLGQDTSATACTNVMYETVVGGGQRG